jgi:nucleotide-binding universal stress UspA family protein
LPAVQRHPPEEADLRRRGATEEVGLSLPPPSRYRCLLVPLDGSAFGEHALPLALGIARQAGAEVRLVHVHSPLESIYKPERLYFDSGLDTWLKRCRQTYLDDVVRRLAKVSSVPVTPVLMEGREIGATLCAAAGADTDLVVMAAHRRGALARLWHGSVADTLLQQLSIPLLLVPGQKELPDLACAPALRHVLIPLDGSAGAEQVLDPAVALGTLMGADHTVLQVVHLMTDHALGHGAGGLRRLLAARRNATARGYVRGVAERLGGRTHRVHARVLFDERPPARAILRYAQAHGADVIALAARGRGGLARLFRGSVADRVIRGASVPVLVLRASGSQT